LNPITIVDEHVIRHQHRDALQCCHDSDRPFATNLVGDAAPGDAAEAVEYGVPGHRRAGDRASPGNAVELECIDTEQLDAVDHHKTGDADDTNAQ
jgi:hypothetical protein